MKEQGENQSRGEKKNHTTGLTGHLLPLLVIAGPTAVGKTSLSLQLAEAADGEIISADSMQIYRKMDIGTAKVSPAERAMVKHHLLDLVEPDQDFSVAEYQLRADKIIPQITARGKLPIMVGGTGLYIQAVVAGFLFPEMEKDISYREKLRKLAAEHGNDYLHQQLKEVDPELAAKRHPNDQRRIIRGLEVYHLTGKTVTYYKRAQKNRPPRYQALKIALTRERAELYQRINDRVDQMLAGGLIEEVQQLLQQGYDISHTALQGLGYKEIIAYLEGEFKLDEAVRILKRDTRHYAKRQLSWFRRDKDYHWFNLSREDPAEIMSRILTLLREKEIQRRYQ